MRVEDKLKQMGLEMHEVGKPIASYVYVKRVGKLLYLSGHGPFVGRENRQVYKGKVGREISIEQAMDAARIAALNCLSSIKAAIGDLDRVKSIVRVTAYVRCDDNLDDYYTVVDVASDLLITLFGDAGKHSRMAIGICQLPRGVPIAMDMIVEVAD